MIEKFVEYFEGYFDNQDQAFTHPTLFALIQINHTKLDENSFSVTQKYSFEDEPYRNNIIKIFQENDHLLVKNYKEDGLTYLDGCDTIFYYQNDSFFGKTKCNECYITRNGKDTYLISDIILSNGIYVVSDKGYDINTDELIWGSFNGSFHFLKK